jgi:hypothetical protein
MQMREAVEKVVKKHFLDQMDERMIKLRNCANYDLHFGPHNAEYYRDSAELEDWPGYVTATDQLEEWAQDKMQTVWVDIQTMEVFTTEPEETEFSDEDIYKFDRRDLGKIVFGKLVTDGGMSV